MTCCQVFGKVKEGEGPEEFTFSRVNGEDSEEDDEDDHMLIDAQSKPKAGNIRTALEAAKTDLKSGKRKALTQTGHGG